MKPSLTTRTVLGGVGLALIAAATLGLLAVRISEFRHSARLQAESAHEIAVATRLERAVLGLESGMRGYLITMQPAFLQPYRAAERDYPALSVELERLAAHDPAQAVRARELTTAIVRYHGLWTMPLIELARTDPDAARARVASGRGREMVAAMRRQFQKYLMVEEARNLTRRDAVVARARDAEIFAAASIGVSGILIMLFALYLHRTTVLPIRRLANAAGRLAIGDLSTRVHETGVAEVGELKRNFNAMAAALENNRDELEAQNAELETQQIEIERTLEDLGAEQEKLAVMSEFSGGLVALSTHRETTEFILDRLCNAAKAELAALYTASTHDPDALVLGSTRGIDASSLRPTVAEAGGLAARAVDERRTVAAQYGESGLRVHSLGGELVVQSELHVPLVRSGVVVGVVTLARVGSRSFDAVEIDLIERLATQAAVALEQARTHAQAAHLAELNRTLIEAIPDGIRLLDLEGNVLAENPRIAQLAYDVLQLDPKESAYAAIPELAELMDAPEAYRSSLLALREDPELEGFDEFTFKESQRSFRRHTVPVRDGEGKVVARLYIVRETTAARELDRLKEEFVSSVSHELRTPLASIVGFVELLLGEEPGPLTADQREFVGIVKRSSQRLHRLVGDLLFVAQVDAQQLTVKKEEVDLGEVVRHAAAAAQPEADRRRIALVVELARTPPIQADGERIAQVLDNLLSNALKFTPDGGQVKVATAVGDDHVAIVVSDTGIGIPAAERDRLFARFFRASTAIDEQIAGTGLGLAITKAIAEAHDGTISFDDVPGGGTSFRVQLPLSHRLEVVP